MPDPTTPQSASQTEGWFNAAPTGDSFDELFPPTEGTPAPTTAQPTGAPSPESVAQPQPADEPFLKAATGTVYKTREDAVKGIEAKDAAIQQLREQLVARTGVDPFTGRPVAIEPQSPRSYLEDRGRYFQDLRTAVAKGDEGLYFETQAKLISDMISPYMPVVVGTAKEQALRALPEEVRGYVNTPDYSETLKDIPLLAQAIQAAEQSPQLFQQLPDLYRLAYAQNITRKLPEITRAAQPSTAQSPQNTAPRPSLTPGTLTPQGTPTAPPSLATREGRKAIIDRGIASGLADLTF